LARDPEAQRSGGFLCESEAAATTGFCLRESEAAAAKRPVGTEINPLLQ